MNTPPVSTPSQPAAPPARDAAGTRTPPRPSRAEQDRFDGALRRAGERSASPEDEAPLHNEKEQDAAHENLLAAAVSAVPCAVARAPVVAGLTAAPLSATGNAMALQIAQPASLSSALSPHAPGASPQAWAVQLTDSGLPVQQLHLQRAAGGLQLSLGTSTDTRRLPLDRLRERLVGKGAALQSLRQHPLSDEPAQGSQDP
jgi:hypothetical protein